MMDEKEKRPDSAATERGPVDESRQSNHTEGRELKQLAFDLFEKERGEQLAEARRRFIAIAVERGRVTINDVRNRMAIPPELDPRWLGAVPSPFAHRGIVRRAGDEPSGCAHGRYISVWELVRIPTSEEIAEIVQGGRRKKARPDRPDDNGDGVKPGPSPVSLPPAPSLPPDGREALAEPPDTSPWRECVQSAAVTSPGPLFGGAPLPDRPTGRHRPDAPGYGHD